MNAILKYAAAAALTGALALTAITPSQARDGRNTAAAIGFGAGAIVGAAAASNYNRGYYYEPGYAYEPAYTGAYAYETVPVYRRAPRGYGPDAATYAPSGCTTSGTMYGHSTDNSACY